MSVSPQVTIGASSDDEPPSFESALTDLQQIVGDLESGVLGLEDALRHYERGAGLLRHCYSLLESAERRIEILTGRTEEGEPETAPFDATATHEPATSKAGRRARTRTARKPEEPETASDPDALF